MREIFLKNENSSSFGTRVHGYAETENQILHARYPRPARLSQRGTGSEEIRHNQGW